VVVRQHRQQRVGRGAGAARRARPGLNVIILSSLLTLRASNYAKVPALDKPEQPSIIFSYPREEHLST
jgi:hypothetical protein